MTQPRGIRNNNPLNIRKTDTAWRGKVVGSDQEFETFATPEHGIRAAARILQTYQETHNLDTVKGVISRWAPPSENDTSAYVQAVSIWADFEPEEPIDMGNYDTVYRLLRAMTRMENGKPTEPKTMWYPDDIWEKGIRMAGLSPSKPLTHSRTAVSTASGAVASTGAVGVLSGLLGLPEWLEDLLPTALSSFTEQQVAIGILLLVGLTQWRTIFARVDDKLKGRL